MRPCVGGTYFEGSQGYLSPHLISLVKERAVHTAQYLYCHATVVLNWEPECHWNSQLN